MSSYFESLRDEMNNALNRCRKNIMLKDYIASITANNDDILTEAIYNMFFDITSTQVQR